MICPLMSAPLHVGNRKKTIVDKNCATKEIKQAVIQLHKVDCIKQNCPVWITYFNHKQRPIGGRCGLKQVRDDRNSIKK